MSHSLNCLQLCCIYEHIRWNYDDDDDDDDDNDDDDKQLNNLAGLYYSLTYEHRPKRQLQNLKLKLRFI